MTMTMTKTVQTRAAAGIAGTSTGACSLQAHGGKHEIRFDWHRV